MTTDNSPFAKISSPGTPGTPRRLDNPSALWETPPDMGAPRELRPERRQICDWPFSRSAAVCVASAAARWTIMSRCMRFKGASRWATLLLLASEAQSRSVREKRENTKYYGETRRNTEKYE